MFYYSKLDAGISSNIEGLFPIVACNAIINDIITSSIPSWSEHGWSNEKPTTAKDQSNGIFPKFEQTRLLKLTIFTTFLHTSMKEEVKFITIEILI